jgi:hypothetical protein
VNAKDSLIKNGQQEATQDESRIKKIQGAGAAGSDARVEQAETGRYEGVGP